MISHQSSKKGKQLQICTKHGITFHWSVLCKAWNCIHLEVFIAISHRFNVSRWLSFFFLWQFTSLDDNRIQIDRFGVRKRTKFHWNWASNKLNRYQTRTFFFFAASIWFESARTVIYVILYFIGVCRKGKMKMNESLAHANYCTDYIPWWQKSLFY